MRKGRYRKILIPEEKLQAEASLMYQKLVPFFELREREILSDPEIVGAYLLVYLQQRRPSDWVTGPHSESLSLNLPLNRINILDLPQFSTEIKSTLKKKLGDPLKVSSIFNTLSFRSVPLSANRALVKWMDGSYPLTLMTHVPSPLEVLELQAAGKRCVTLLREENELKSLVLEQRDPLGFVLHDLIHADHFYSNRFLMPGQIGFARLMKRAFDKGLFCEMRKQDPIFSHELDYVIADMNSYCVHMMKCLKAICLGYFLRLEAKSPKETLSPSGTIKLVQFMESLCLSWEADSNVGHLISQLNGDEKQERESTPLLQNFFDKNAQIEISSNSVAATVF